MKGLLRSRAVQSVLAWLVWAYASFVTATLRWTYENRAPADEALASPDGLVALFWHGRIAHAIACRPMMAGKPVRALISLSRDGEFIAMAADRLGVPAIRGSAGRGDRAMSKGGAAALRQAVEFVRAGGMVLATPDGPKGPREVLPAGPLYMAQSGGRPAFLMGLAARPALGFSSWDEARLPLPFARACLVIVGPLSVPADANDAQVDAMRADWQDQMRAAQALAETRLGLTGS